MSQVARQINFGIFLGWLEEIDIELPVFHEAVWRWYASTHPADRHRDRAVYQLYQIVGRGLAEIPDFSTGRPIRPATANLGRRGGTNSGFRRLEPSRGRVAGSRRLPPRQPQAAVMIGKVSIASQRSSMRCKPGSRLSTTIPCWTRTQSGLL